MPTRVSSAAKVFAANIDQMPANLRVEYYRAGARGLVGGHVCHNGVMPRIVHDMWQRPASAWLQGNGARQVRTEREYDGPLLIHAWRCDDEIGQRS